MLQLMCSKDCKDWIEGASGSSSCRVRERLTQSLQIYYQYSSFRPGQLQALLPVAHSRDVFVRLPTGGGKTLCMFLMPLSIDNTAMGVIISPLVCLIEQQVCQLNAMGVTAVHAVNVTQIQDITHGKFRFVFMSPETAVASEWRTVFTHSYVKQHLVLIAVDEAHCIPEWGVDFRRAFKRVGELRATIDVPFMALTASASPPVQSEIIRTLHLDSPVTVSISFDRPNIYISAAPIRSLCLDLGGLSTLLKASNVSDIPKTIVYVPTKNTACKVYSYLRAASTNKLSVGMYHASLTQTTKSSICHSFLSSNSLTRCLIATIAFRMGMDIADIAIVIVYGTPSTMCQLYQLFGRAGRSGSASLSHLFYIVRKTPEKDPNLEHFIKQRENCRRRCILESLGDSSLQGGSNPACCDCCTPSALTLPEYNKLAQVLRQKPVERKKRRRVVRRVNVDVLRARLVNERDNLLEKRPEFYMVGVSFLCADSVIDRLCEKAKYIETIQDIPPQLFGIRTELKATFFPVISDTCSIIQTRTKRRCV